MSISLLSFYTPEYQPLANVTLPNKQEYCDKLEYLHLVKTTPYGNKDNYYAFQRIQYLRDLLFASENDLEAVLVLNIHTMVMNFNTKIESFLDNEHDFYICKDVNGINAGTFLIKKSDWSKKWLDFILSKESVHKNHCWFEQKLIQDNWELPEFKDKVKILPHPSINSYFYNIYNWPETTPGHFNKGDFILHLPGLGMEQRINIFKSDAVKDKIIK
jgi:hypothetical protein